MASFLIKTSSFSELRSWLGLAFVVTQGSLALVPRTPCFGSQDPTRRPQETKSLRGVVQVSRSSPASDSQEPIGPPPCLPQLIVQTTHSHIKTRQNILILAATRVRIGRGLGRVVNPIESETDPDPCQIHPMGDRCSNKYRC